MEKKVDGPNQKRWKNETRKTCLYFPLHLATLFRWTSGNCGDQMRNPVEIIHNGKTLTEILRLHKKWRESDPDGARANLGNADLRNADLSNADFRTAYLSNADLSYAYLGNADLRNSDLSNSDLSYADLSYSDLSNSNLSYADLSNADLRNAKRHSKNIAKFAFAHELYNYPVFAFIFDDGSKMIEMGCKHQSPEEWETNFWNNTNEFPDDGSAKTKRRILALKWANDVLKIMEDKK
jgi:hypothetical protein